MEGSFLTKEWGFKKLVRSEAFVYRVFLTVPPDFSNIGIEILCAKCWQSTDFVYLFVFFCDSYLNLLLFCTCIVFYIRQQTQPKRLPNGMMQRWSNYFDLSFFLCNFVLSCICLVLYLRRRPVEDSPKCRRAPPAVRGVDTGGHCRPGDAGGDIEYFNWILFVLYLHWILLSHLFTWFDCAIFFILGS